MAVTYKRKGLDDLLKRNAELKGVAVRFGSMGPNGSPSMPHPSSPDLSVAEVLAMHEYGLGNLPERSIVRAVANGNRRELAEAAKSAASAGLEGGGSVADKIGEVAVDLLLSRHDSLGMVVDRDGFTRPALDDTGAIRGSLGWRVER